MSLVKITDHDEVIYNILNKPPPEPPKTPRYESQLEKELKKRKIPQLCLTFGYAEVPMTKPDNYLKKGQGIRPPKKEPSHKCVQSGNLPPVPKRQPPRKKEDHKPVNFRVNNIKTVLKMKPRSPKPRLVDTKDGHIKGIKGSGEVPEYCLRPDFGQMPAYLVKRNNKIRRRKQRLQEIEDNRESLCKLITAEERQKLLDDLKSNWQIMQKAFLQLPMLTDTIPKIMKKEKLEKELKDIEKDIALIEYNPYIYVFEGNEK